MNFCVYPVPMPPSDQTEIEATFQAALERRGHGGSIDAAVQTVSRQLVGRKKDMQAFILSVERIRADLDQVRQQGKTADAEETKQLAASIREQGLLQPLDVRWHEADDIYQIVAGERRFIAVTQILGWTEVPVRILDATDEQIVWLQLHENIHREGLHALDLARAIRSTMEQGLTIDEIAAKLCKSTTFVQKALTVSSELTDAAAEHLRSSPQGRSLDAAYEVATVPPERQAEVAKTIVEGNLPQKEIRRLTAAEKSNRSTTRNRRGRRPSDVKPFARTVRASNGAFVTINFRKKRVATSEMLAALRDVTMTLEHEQHQEESE